MLRNFCNKLKALGKITNNSKGFVPVELRKKSWSKRFTLEEAIVGAVNYRKEQENITQNDKVKNLKIDIKNALNHVFGDHQNYASYFCKPEKHSDDQNNVIAL